VTVPPACACTGAIEPGDSDVVVVDGAPAWHRLCYDLARNVLPLVVQTGVLVDAWWHGRGLP
jgi:hypothetical protein